MSCIKSEYSEPTYDYNSEQDNAWTFYNHVTFALKKAHPRNWLQDSQTFHDFMMSNVVSNVNLNALEDISHKEDHFSWAIDFGGNNSIVGVDEEVIDSNAIVEI